MPPDAGSRQKFRNYTMRVTAFLLLRMWVWLKVPPYSPSMVQLISWLDSKVISEAWAIKILGHYGGEHGLRFEGIGGILDQKQLVHAVIQQNLFGIEL